MNDKTAVVAEVCAALSANRPEQAGGILRDRYPFVPLTNGGRRTSLRQTLRVFMSDGFIDRYSGDRLVLPAALRLISKLLPQEFPFHPHGKMDECHLAFWELLPTIDHLVPVARGGADDPTNWMSTSMLRNAAKANATIEELGWSVQPPGDPNEWDGLTEWFMDQARSSREIRDDPYLRPWYLTLNQLRAPVLFL
jgi:hypothetical protein